MRTKGSAPYFNTTVDADVEIDPEDLHEAGWHHENECKTGPDTEPDPESLGPALASLHRQAHPGQARDVVLCREEPCRSLSLAQLRQVNG